MIYKTVGADAEAELNPHRWTEPPLQHEDSRLAVRTGTSPCGMGGGDAAGVF